jgi:hypothetical protein
MLRSSYGVCLLGFTVLLYSCKDEKHEKLLGKWQSEKIENRNKDEFFSSSKIFIDTMGKGNTDAGNILLYGIANVDSLSAILKAQYDSAMAVQQAIDTQSVFTFNEDGTMILSFPGREETGKWSLDKSGRLILDETNEMGQTERVNVELTSVDDNKLTLTFIRKTEQGEMDTSKVTFRRSGK